MPLRFRNLTITSVDPVTDWPTEAVQTALERGDLSDWQRVVAEIGRAPWGTTARQVEEILTHSRPYGVAELMEAAVTRARRRAEHAEREAVAVEIRDAINRSGLSQAEFASRVGTSASRLSTYASAKASPRPRSWSGSGGCRRRLRPRSRDADRRDRVAERGHDRWWKCGRGDGEDGEERDPTTRNGLEVG